VMNLASILQYAALLALTTVSVKPVGDYLERVFSRKPTKLDRFLFAHHGFELFSRVVSRPNSGTFEPLGCRTQNHLFSVDN
jgi:hypothetical protein